MIFRGSRIRFNVQVQSRAGTDSLDGGDGDVKAASCIAETWAGSRNPY